MQPSEGGVNINKSKDKMNPSPVNDRDKKKSSEKSDPDATESSKGYHVRDEAHGEGLNWMELVTKAYSYILAICLFPLSLIWIIKVVNQYERAVIMRFGRIYGIGVYGPGIIFYLPCMDDIIEVDLRTICFDVPPQEALTKDSLTVSVDAVILYKVFDPISAVINVADYSTSTEFLAATTLRNALGAKNLVEILADRPGVSMQVFENMKATTHPWGIKVVRVELKDISLPPLLQKAMAAEAESTRLANAKIIVAKAEIEATKNLQKATLLLMDNPMCIQLRYLQSLQQIVGENTHTIVFPFSVQNLKKIFK